MSRDECAKTSVSVLEEELKEVEERLMSEKFDSSVRSILIYEGLLIRRKNIIRAIKEEKDRKVLQKESSYATGESYRTYRYYG